jgi:hypothetical protein
MLTESNVEQLIDALKACSLDSDFSNLPGMVYLDRENGFFVTPSEYPDIDMRMGQMIEVVRNFPPLPQGYQHDSIQFGMTFRFPLGCCNS